MTEDEKFLFDLQGYLVLPGVIDVDTLAGMNAWIDAKAETDPAFRPQKRNAQALNPITWAPEFLALLDHPRVLPYLIAVMGERLRLDHDYAIFLEPGHGGMRLHGPNSIPFDPIHYYRCDNGEIRCGLTVASFALTDVPPGAGGLAVISGSHKLNFPVPMDIMLYDRFSPVVQQVPMKAGDCVIFTEALIHGTLPWKGPGIRRTLFYKYAPCQLAWENRTYAPPEAIGAAPPLLSRLTERQRLLLQPPSAIEFHAALPAVAVPSRSVKGSGTAPPADMQPERKRVTERAIKLPSGI